KAARAGRRPLRGAQATHCSVKEAGMKCDKIGIRVWTNATALKALTVVLTVSWGASAAARPSPSSGSSATALPVSQESEQRPAPTRGDTVAAGDRQILQKLH